MSEKSIDYTHTSVALENFLDENRPEFPTTDNAAFLAMQTAYTAMVDSVKNLVSARISVSKKWEKLGKADQKQNKSEEGNSIYWNYGDFPWQSNVIDYAASWAAARIEFRSFVNTLERTDNFCGKCRFTLRSTEEEFTLPAEKHLYWRNLRRLQDLISYCFETTKDVYQFLNSIPSHQGALSIIRPRDGGLTSIAWENVRGWCNTWTGDSPQADDVPRTS